MAVAHVTSSTRGFQLLPPAACGRVAPLHSHLSFSTLSLSSAPFWTYSGFGSIDPFHFHSPELSPGSFLVFSGPAHDSLAAPLTLDSLSSLLVPILGTLLPDFPLACEFLSLVGEAKS